MASYRYRAQFPANALGCAINDPSADTLIFSKPQASELSLTHGKRVIVDICDDHFARYPHYLEFLKRADLITCSSHGLQGIIGKLGYHAEVIPEAYEFPHADPHSNGNKLLWFGHKTNFYTLERVLPELKEYELSIVCDGFKPWSHETMLEEFAKADIVILPATKDYKSPNRAVEAIRQGCWVVAEPHPSLQDFPIWKGSIAEGIKAPRYVQTAQTFITGRYSPKVVASAWKKILESI